MIEKMFLVGVTIAVGGASFSLIGVLLMIVSFVLGLWSGK